MSNLFKFKQFQVQQSDKVMKVNTDSCILGSMVGSQHFFQQENLNTSPQNILDIGTGTGVVALMLAQRFTSPIFAIDSNPNAYVLAKGNFENSIWENRLFAIHQTFQTFSESNVEKFDLLVSNPPYFSNSLKSSNHNKMEARHNDSLPLATLTQLVSKQLSNQGEFWVILPLEEGEFVKEFAQRVGLFLLKEIVVFYKEGKEAKRVVLCFNKKQRETEFAKLLVYNQSNEYTNHYKSLLEAYLTIF